MNVTPAATGRLKVYLGYAAGVGKTYRMLEDAQALAASGADLVIGYLETHGREDTAAKAEGLQVVPRATTDYRGVALPEMDVDGVIARSPAVCLVDEIAHTNAPGSRHAKRWEDVMELLDSGIDVWTTLNIQHLESLNDKVAQITGIRVRETVPDWVVAQCDEVVMVDLTPHALLNRLRRGVVYAPAQAERALRAFFKEGTLVALRELALRHAAHEVETRSAATDENLPPAPAGAASAPPVAERLLLHVTPDPSTAVVIRRGRRLADYLHADALAVYVHPGNALSELSEERRAAIEKLLEFARRLHIETRVLYSRDEPAALVDFARLHHVTQILLLRPDRARRWPPPAHQLANRVVRLAGDLQVIIVASRLTSRD